jgi:nucleotide-binding universal stress UspA family protein
MRADRRDDEVEPEEIVVGVDGSDGGRRALLFALREARLRRCAVEAVRVARSEDDAALSDYELWADIVAMRQQLPGAPGVSLRVFVGDPAEILIERSETAALLVVGSHGTNSLIHSAMGSVSNACAQLAHCPVVVLPRGLHPVVDKSQEHGTSVRSAGV